MEQQIKIKIFLFSQHLADTLELIGNIKVFTSTCTMMTVRNSTDFNNIMYILKRFQAGVPTTF